MNKLVKLARALPSTWTRYLWVSMRHNERGYERCMRKARECARAGRMRDAASRAGSALSYAKSADQERRFLGL